MPRSTALRALHCSGVVGLGVRAPLPGRNDGRGASLRPPRAEGVAVIGSVGYQAGPRHARPSFHQGPGLGAVVALAARHAQAQGTSAAIRQDMDLGAKSAPVTAEGRIGLSVFGRVGRAHMRAHDRAIQPHGGQIRIELQVGHPARPDAPIAPVGIAAIDRVPLAVRGRQLTPIRARPCQRASTGRVYNI